MAYDQREADLLKRHLQAVDRYKAAEKDLEAWQKVARHLASVLRKNGVGGYEFNKALEAFDSLEGNLDKVQP